MRLTATRSEKYKAELRADILTAAREIFIRDGYEGFTIRKLAKRIGFSPGNMYLYFKNKNELFDCLVDESFADLLAALPQPENTTGEDPVQLLKRSLRIYVKFGLEHPNHYRFSFLLRPASQPRPHKQRAAYQSLLRKVQLCIQSKRFRTRDADLAAQSLWAAAHGIASLFIERPKFPWVGRDRLIDQVLDSAVDGLLR